MLFRAICFYFCNNSNLSGLYYLYIELNQSQGYIIFTFHVTSLTYMYFHPERDFISSFLSFRVH